MQKIIPLRWLLGSPENNTQKQSDVEKPRQLERLFCACICRVVLGTLGEGHDMSLQGKRLKQASDAASTEPALWELGLGDCKQVHPSRTSIPFPVGFI